MEVYSPIEYVIESHGSVCNYTLLRSSFFGSREEVKGSLTHDNTLFLKPLSYYTLVITSQGNNQISRMPIEIRPYSFDSEIYISPFTIYFLIFLLGILTAFSDLPLYIQNPKSVVSIYYICFWINKFISEIDEERLKYNKDDEFIDSLNTSLISQKDRGLSEKQVYDFLYLNLDKHINNLAKINSTGDDYERIRTAQLAVAVVRLSNKGAEYANNLMFSYSYNLLEYFFKRTIQTIYIPASKKLLEFYMPKKLIIDRESNIYTDNVYKNLVVIEKAINLDKKYLGVINVEVLKTVIIGTLTFLTIIGITLANVSQIPLLFKLIVVLYLSLNITMFYCLSYLEVFFPKDNVI